MAGLSAVVDPDLYGVFPLSSELLNVRDSRELLKKKEIQILMTILGLVRNKKYSDAECLRYGWLMIMANQVSNLKIIVYFNALTFMFYV